MTRLMMTLAAVFALALFAGPLAADEAHRENTREFVESLDGLNEAILGEHAFDMRILGQTVGKVDITIEESEKNGAECYLVTLKARGKVGVDVRIDGTEYLRPDFGVISSEMKQFEGEDLEEHTTVERADGKINVVVKRPQEEDEDRQETTAEYEPDTTQFFGSAEVLLLLSLPQKPANYEFDDFDTNAGKFSKTTVEAKGEVEKFGAKSFRLQITSVEFEEGDDGEFTESEEETETFVWEGRLIHMESSQGFVYTTGPEREFTPITREQIEKQEDAVAVAAGFFLGFQEKDEELLASLIDEVEFIYNFLDSNEQTADLPEDQKRAMASAGAATLIPGMLQNQPEPEDENEAKQREAFTKLMLNREHFQVSKTDEGYRSTFTEEAARYMGEFTMGIRKNEETGKLEIIYLNEDEEEGDAEEEEQPEEEPEDPSPEEDEFSK